MIQTTKLDCMVHACSVRHIETLCSVSVRIIVAVCCCEWNCPLYRRATVLVLTFRFVLERVTRQLNMTGVNYYTNSTSLCRV